MIVWPWGVLTPRVDRWHLQGVAMSGGVNVGGTTRLARMDGGGLWIGEQTFLFHSRAQIKAARAIEAYLDGGVSNIVAWSYEQPFAPTGLTLGTVPHSDDTPFNDDAEYTSAPIGGTVTADAALRATTLSVTAIAGAFEGGERFTIVHPTKGHRRYTIMRVDDDVITIRPPLREAVTVGTDLDFLRVGCVCRLANPDEFMGALNVAHHIEATARWVEAF